MKNTWSIPVSAKMVRTEEIRHVWCNGSKHWHVDFDGQKAGKQYQSGSCDCKSPDMILSRIQLHLTKLGLDAHTFLAAMDSLAHLRAEYNS